LRAVDKENRAIYNHKRVLNRAIEAKKKILGFEKPDARKHAKHKIIISIRAKREAP